MKWFLCQQTLFRTMSAVRVEIKLLKIHFLSFPQGKLAVIGRVSGEQVSWGLAPESRVHDARWSQQAWRILRATNTRVSRVSPDSMRLYKSKLMRVPKWISLETITLHQKVGLIPITSKGSVDKRSAIRLSYLLYRPKDFYQPNYQPEGCLIFARHIAALSARSHKTRRKEGNWVDYQFLNFLRLLLSKNCPSFLLV